MKTGQELIRGLREFHPEIAIIVSRRLDAFHVWDGDGPDGFSPYSVTVEAVMIVNGELVRGESSLGALYYRPDEELGEVAGYLPQMIEEAVMSLNEGITQRFIRKVDEVINASPS